MNLFMIIYVSIISVLVLGGGSWYIIRTRKLRHYIRVFVHMPDDRIKYYVVRPYGESVTVGKPGLTFLLTKEKAEMWKGLPTYNYRFDNVFPLVPPDAAASGEATATPLIYNPKDKKPETETPAPAKLKNAPAVLINPKKEQTPAQLAAFKRSEFIKKVLESANGGMKIALPEMLSIIILGLVIGVAYLTYTNGQEIIDKLDYIISLLTSGGGMV